MILPEPVTVPMRSRGEEGARHIDEKVFESNYTVFSLLGADFDLSRPDRLPRPSEEMECFHNQTALSERNITDYANSFLQKHPSIVSKEVDCLRLQLGEMTHLNYTRLPFPYDECAKAAKGTISALEGERGLYMVLGTEVRCDLETYPILDLGSPRDTQRNFPLFLSTAQEEKAVVHGYGYQQVFSSFGAFGD